MALVREMVTSNGVHVKIFDDCYAGISKEELERRKREIAEAIARVDINHQMRQLKAAQEAAQEAARQ